MSPVRPRCAHILAVLAVAVARPAAADNEELSRLTLEELLAVRVSTASKFPQTAGEAPSSVTVITAADIRTFGYRTFADILNSIRGVYVTNDQTYAFLGVRGFGRAGDYNGRVLVLIDGNRINENIFSGANLGTEFPVDVELIDRVEFVSGPGSAIYGNNALFGVANVITRRPARGGSEVALEGGSEATRKARAVLSAKPGAQTSVLVSASAYASDGRAWRYPEYDDAATPGGTAPRELDHDRVKRALLRLDHGAFGFEVLRLERRKGIPSASYGQVFGDTRSRTDDEQTLQQAWWSGALGPAANLSVRQFAGDYAYAGRYVYDLGSGADINRDEAHGRWWGVEAKLDGTLPGGHRWIAGWEYQRNTRQDQLNFDEATGVVYVDDRRESSTGNLYFQDEWTAREDLRLNAGVHLGTGDEGGRRAYPRLGAIYAPAPGTTLKAIYGSAFRRPNVYEAFYGQEGQIAVSRDLRPEEIRTAELTLEQRVGPSTRLVASAFHYRLSDLISLGTDPASGLLQYQNLAQANARGFEAEAEHWFATGARLKASLSFQRARDDATGEVLDNSPERLAKVHFSAPLWGERASLGIEGLYVGERLSVRGVRVPSFKVANLTLVARPWREGVELSASVYNLFDEKYGDPAAIEQYDSRGRMLDQIPREGRSWRVTASYRF